jgi:aminomethyltransferase
VDRRTMPAMDEPQDPQELKHTPLADVHDALGAKMAPFAGWVMPIEYEGALAEHKAVRERVGLFDLTHLGKVDVTGPGAFGMLQSVITNDLGKAAVGEALYNLVLNEGGGVIEDLIVYRLAEERFFVVPNAANAHRVLQILEETPSEDRLHLMYHQDWCFLAVQGPESVHVMRRLFPEAGDLAFMQCVEAEYRRRPVILTRSGYTGEVGFELFTYQDVAHELWADLTEAMAPFGGQPCGRVTCCGSRWAIRCTDRTCSNRGPRSRPACRGLSLSTRATSADAPRSPARRRRVSRADSEVSGWKSAVTSLAPTTPCSSEIR